MHARGVAMAAAWAALTACWTPPRAPDGSAAIPGALWTTPAKPWRFEQWVTLIVPDGATAMLAIGMHELVRLDLPTGRAIRVRAIPEPEIHALRHLADGRWLATARSTAASRARRLTRARSRRLCRCAAIRSRAIPRA